MNFKFKYTERIVGVFFFTALLILLFALVSQALNSRMFETKYPYKSIFKDANGLSVNTPIYFKGFQIGKITKYNLNKENLIDVTFHVFDQYKDKIVENSVLRKTTNIVSAKSSIELIQGPNLNARLKANSYVPGSDTPDGIKIVRQHRLNIASEEVTAIVDDIKKITGNFLRDHNAEEGAPFRAIYNAANATENLNKTLISANELMGKFSKDNNPQDGAVFRTINNFAQISEELKTNTARLNNTIDLVDSLINLYSQVDGIGIRMLDPNEDKFVQPIRDILKGLNQNLQIVNNTLSYIEEQTPEISVLIQESRNALLESQKTIESLNNNPFLKKGFSKEKTNQNSTGQNRPKP